VAGFREEKICWMPGSLKFLRDSLRSGLSNDASIGSLVTAQLVPGGQEVQAIGNTQQLKRLFRTESTGYSITPVERLVPGSSMRALLI